MAEKKELMKGFFTFTGLDGNKYRLSLKEKNFCNDFLEFKGNGTEAAYNNYKCKNIRVAGVIATENLRKHRIVEYINTKLKEYGFNDDNVKKQHLFLLNQFADFGAKKSAIDMFYKIKGTYAPEKSIQLKGDIVKLVEQLDKGRND